MKRRRGPRSREWKRRDKVSACTSGLFPWEVVCGILERSSPRSLVLLQMVSRGVRAALLAEKAMWVRIFRRSLFSTAYLTTKVYSPEYPGLSLHKGGLNGIPVHMGRIRTDPDGASLPPEFDEAFCAYTRKAFALTCVDRCGLCGCRHRHDAYWSLGMRVCRLCVADNSVSSWELVSKYGVHYYDIIRDITGKVFYYFLPASLGDPRMPLDGTLSLHVAAKWNLIMFWRPHREKVLDLPALYQEQGRRRGSALLVCALLRRLRVYSLRREHARHALRSPDCLVLRLFLEEKRRLCNPYTSKWANPHISNYKPGDGAWAFWDPPVCGKSRHQLRHGEPREAIAAHIAKWEDIVV